MFRHSGRTRPARANRGVRPLAHAVAVGATGALMLAVPAAQAAVSPSAPAATEQRARAVAAQDEHTKHEIHRFLTWFYGDHGPNDFQRQYWVSDALEEKQQQNPDQDVLLCAQNAPQDIRIGPVTVAQSAGVGWATVTATWADGSTTSFTAYVELDSHPIELHDVACGS